MCAGRGGHILYPGAHTGGAARVTREGEQVAPTTAAGLPSAERREDHHRLVAVLYCLSDCTSFIFH